MIEARALISNINKVRQKLTLLGAIFDNNYIFTDIIFIPNKKKYNLAADYLRARIYTKNSWPTKKVVLTRKQTKFKNVGKVDKIILKKEFDTKQEALDFVSTKFGSQFEYGFEYEREGWQYNFEKIRIFVEDIKGYKPSVEIEANSQEQMQNIFEKIGILEQLHDSTPEIMRKALKCP